MNNCQAERCANEIRESRNLPKNVTVPVLILCKCPRCSPNLRC